MWAIVYRAPDSTGIGLAGSEQEPIKIRRELGSVVNLSDGLNRFPVFEDSELRVVSAMDPPPRNLTDVIIQNQKKLLALEGFDPGAHFSGSQRSTPAPLWSELTDSRAGNVIPPGTPGSEDIQTRLRIDTPNRFRLAVKRFTRNFDLPLVVVESLFTQAFRSRVNSLWERQAPPIDKETLLAEFRQVFASYAQGEHPGHPKRADSGTGRKHPYTRKYLWKCLHNLVVVLPSDHAIDGVANLFRSIDRSVLAGSTPERDDRIQEIFDAFWAMTAQGPPMHWKSLYRTERLYNVYGIAAAAALACFQAETLSGQVQDRSGQGSLLPADHIPGQTHPLLLRHMAGPVLGQGRWALQSAISVRNSHPFVDEKKLRAVVLNGQFNADIETRVQAYLTRVAGLKMRSENSTELFSLLWGYYFDTVENARQRYAVIERQHRLGLEDISICSQSVDYSIFKTLKDKSTQDIDEYAFVQAMEVMIQSGGQFAVAGFSLVARDRLFVGTHNRPIYIVKRRQHSDFMVVSDINAAIGLFPQSLIQSTTVRLRKLMKEAARKSVIVEPRFFEQPSSRFQKEKMALLAPFEVEIFALDQPRTFARILSRPGTNALDRALEIRDFNGNKKGRIQAETTHLTPIAFEKDFGKSFYEEHLTEIPGLLREILDRYTQGNLPRFDIRDRLLTRRFGKSFSSLRRIILISTGFSYELAHIVEKNMERFLPGVNIIVTTPLDMGSTRGINPDRDLVVMISWSGTTSDMIDFATLLLKRKILMVGVTEKPFSDLGLILRKSGGVIPVLSGEEATVAPLKTSVCMLMILDLFCLYARRTVTGETDTETARLISEMQTLPEEIHAMLDREDVLNFCRQVSGQACKTWRHYIIDALHKSGTGRLAALNLELNAWTSMGAALDYSEQQAFLGTAVTDKDLVLVQATHSRQLDRAADFMRSLDRAGIPFSTVTYTNREKDQFQNLSRQTIFLPKVPDYFQPLIDLPFFFLLGYYFGLAQGRLSGEMPRNMVKSVTAGRMKDRSKLTREALMENLAEKNSRLTFCPASSPLAWMAESQSQEETRFYKDILTLSARFHAADPFTAFFDQADPADLGAVYRFIFSYLADDGVILFVPMDKYAESGCRNFIRLWEPLFPPPLQIEYPEEIKGLSTEDSLVVVVGSRTPDAKALEEVTAKAQDGLVWIGPPLETPALRASFSASLGNYFLAPTHADCPYEEVYFALSQFFCTVFRDSGQAGLVGTHLKSILPSVKTLFSDMNFRQAIQRTIAENLSYKKLLFITGSKGSCIAWEYKFQTHPHRLLEGETYGASAYSHLVLVDPDYGAKYVRLKSREKMIQAHSEPLVKDWEDRYLGGTDVDQFLTTYTMTLQPDTAPLFIIDDQWYLPVLKRDYDTDQDCLVIIDATSETRFDAAMDELATFGSRYARIVVITQQQFAQDSRLSNIKKFPISHILILPNMTDRQGVPVAFSDFILPVVMNIMGSAMKFLDTPPLADQADAK
jgi:glucosamine 6-phosphate synthetase-like amidotransferase/phosphosugar isomerase protein